MVAVRRIARSARILVQGLITSSGVITRRVFVKCTTPSGGVETAGRVEEQRIVAARRIGAARGVAKERLITARCVVAAGWYN